MAMTIATTRIKAEGPLARYGQSVLVLQGGGALGAYQAGVYQAMHEAGIEPDWVIGTSIGAINAALIAGNHPGDRLLRLRTFWSRVEQQGSHLATVAFGIPQFFVPNPFTWLSAHTQLGVERAGYYSTSP